MLTMQTCNELWVHYGDLLTDYNLKVTVALTNTSDLLPFLYFSGLTKRHIHMDIYVLF